MDAKVWTLGATLFTLLYLTLGVFVVWAALIVALILAAWVMGVETEGPEGLKYVELELRPALALVGIFALTVVILGPHFPPLLSRNLYPVQYATPTAILHATPVLFYFPLVPLLCGSLMAMHQRFHPLQGFVYQTPPSPSTKVHVHLHTSRSARSRDEEEDAEDEEDSAPKSRRHSHRQGHLQLRHRLRRPHQVQASSRGDDEKEESDEDEEDEEIDEVEDEAPAERPHRNRRPLRAHESAEL